MIVITRTILSLVIIVGLLTTALMSPLATIGTARADSVTATISLGSCALYCQDPQGVAINPVTGNVYVAGVSPSDGAGNVWVINSQTNQVTATIPLSAQASAVAVNPTTGNVYVISGFGDSATVSVINGRTNQVITNIHDGFGNPAGVAVSPKTGNVYVTDAFTSLVSVIDGSTNKIINSIFLNSIYLSPFDIAVSPMTGNVYVLERASFVDLIDASTNQVTTYSTGIPATAVTVSPITGNVYASGPVDQLTSDVVEINGQTNQVITTFPVSGSTGGIAVNPITSNIYAAIHSVSDGAGSVSIINSQTNQVTGSISIGSYPSGLAINPNTGTVYVANSGGGSVPGTVSVISPSTPAQLIQALTNYVNSQNLPIGVKNGLTGPLHQAITLLTDSNPSNDHTVCNKLNAFIGEVNYYLTHGQISQSLATQLIQAAQNIQMVLGCTSGSGTVGSSALTSSPSSLNSTHGTSATFLQPKSQSSYPYTSQYRQVAPVANAGISQTVNENTKVMLDGRSSYSANGGIIAAYQWTQLPDGIPVTLSGANTATPTFTAPVVPANMVLAFSLRVTDNYGAVSTNPAVVYVMIKNDPNVVSNKGATGNITPSTTTIQPQQQQQPIVPNNNASQLRSFPQKGSPTSQNTFPSRVP
jgi:YVTN family beta-propeller protein